MEEKKVQRPFILEMEDAKLEMVQCVNSIVQRGIPLYMVDIILSDIYAQVKEGAKQELAMARKQEEAQEDEEVA